MLGFLNNNTMIIVTFEDFILTVCVIIEDLYHRFAPPEVVSRRNILDAKLSDPEIITISFYEKELLLSFPKLCSRSRFNRTRRAFF